MKSICGIDCTKCPMQSACHGCEETGGRPFGGECVTALYCQKGEANAFRQALLAAINALQIPDMEEVTELYALKGSFINIEYPLPGGQTVKFWDDNKIYLGTQLRKAGTERCYGIAADENDLMVSEYGEQGTDAHIVVFRRWREADRVPDRVQG